MCESRLLLLLPGFKFQSSYRCKEDRVNHLCVQKVQVEQYNALLSKITEKLQTSYKCTPGLSGHSVSFIVKREMRPLNLRTD